MVPAQPFSASFNHAVCCDQISLLLDVSKKKKKKQQLWNQQIICKFGAGDSKNNE